ncbi:unnamed protein product [[Candida] boidinii]|uniref:Unnamed protein product n=1 Tax=Candida boidinii TaxID=5477 RepID=A0ACB5U560_CANBO|nr:unnamed protein product [[Candida] boidinii]
MPYDKVDIIISEWMGYFLLYESMLDTVLVARDRYLKKGGLILPDKASIHVALLEDGAYKDEKIYHWEDVYGFDYSPFIDIAMVEPLVDMVDHKAVVSTSHKLIEFDLNTVTIEQLAFHRDFKLTATRDDLAHALVAWFDIEFPTDKDGQKIVFSTGPRATYTHWKQTVFYLNQVLELKKGEAIDGSLACRPNEKNNRELDIEIEWDHIASSNNDSSSQKGKFNYFLR